MCAVVERWNNFAKIRQDLFGFVDVLCVGNGETVAVQCTSYSHIAARVTKIKESPETVQTLLDAGWRIVVEGWHKPKHKYVRRQVEITEI